MKKYKTKQNKKNTQPGPGHIKAKKSLGQNFLKSKIALDTIIKSGDLKKNDIVLEIGPGKGALTSLLLENGAIVYAIEKDRALVEFLEEKFKREIESKKLILTEEDILEFNIRDIVGKNKKVNYKIIANIPYNITGKILRKFLTEENQPTMMILMLQYEVAKRITGDKKEIKKENLLSISVKAYGNPKYIMKVDKRYFSPSPKVHSAIISIKDISKDLFKKNNIDEEFFWKILKEAFSSKRKKLSNNIKTISKEKFKKYRDFRAEDLSILDWVEIIK